MRRVLLIGVVTVFLTACAFAADAEKPKPTTRPASRPAELSAEQLAQFQKWVVQLGDPDFEAREAADAAIRKMGLPVLPHILKHVNDADAEVAERASQIARFLDLQIPVRADQMEIQLAIQQPKAKVGQRVRLSMTISNKTNKPVLMPGAIGYGYSDPGGYLVVTGPDGEAIAPRSQGKATSSVSNPQAIGGYQPYVRSCYMTLVAGARKDPKATTRPAGADAPFASLQLQDRKTFFPLSVAGKYTLKVRISSKSVAALAKAAAGRKVTIRYSSGLLQVSDVKPFTGVLESNEVTLEVTK